MTFTWLSVLMWASPIKILLRENSIVCVWAWTKEYIQSNKIFVRRSKRRCSVCRQNVYWPCPRFQRLLYKKNETIRNNITPKSKPNVINVMLGNDADSSIDCLEDFAPVTMSETRNVIGSSPSKSCKLDPIPTWLLKSCLRELLPVLTKKVNTSFKTAHVPTAFKST